MKKKHQFVRRNRVLIVCFIALGVYFFYNMHISREHLYTLNQVKIELENEIQTLENDLARLVDEYEYVQTPRAIEQAAREKLKMVRANEIIYLIRGLDDEGENE